MKVVIVGAHDRTESESEKLVNQILDDCIQRYGKLIVVTTFCDRGVGKLIKTRNIDPNKHVAREFDMLEIVTRFWLTQPELSKVEFVTTYNALNGMLVELGDEFHLLVEESVKSKMRDLRDRIIDAGRPYAIYRPSESQGGVKRPVIEVTKQGA